jgi:hypothetical protein
MFNRQEGAMFHRVFVAIIPLVLLVMTGCPSLSTMQTPSTVPKGEVRFGIGLEGVGYSETKSSGSTDSVALPQFEFSARYGVTDDIDIAAKLYLLGAEVGGKYQFLKGDFEAAVAPAVSYISFSAGGDSFSTTYLHLPLLLGYKLSSSFELAFGPKLLYSIVSGTSSDSTQSAATSSGFMAGGFGSLQLKVGKGFWLAPEINVYKPFISGVTGVFWQGGLALLFGADSPH